MAFAAALCVFVFVIDLATTDAIAATQLYPGALLALYGVRSRLALGTFAALAIALVALASLVALNIADDVFRARQQQSSTSGELNERALRLEQLVDDVLAQMTVKQAVSAS